MILTTKFSKPNMIDPSRSRFHSTMRRKASGRQPRKLTLSVSRNTCSTSKKTFTIIIGQCTQRLQDKMHDDDKWDSVNKNKKPLELYALIERAVMKQTDDKYPPCNVVNNLLSVLLMKQQQNMSNAQWYEQFCTRVDVAESVGV